MTNRLRQLFLVVCGSLLLGGCATDTPKPTDPKPISTIPFNRPERWEGQGMLGGMMGTQ